MALDISAETPRVQYTVTSADSTFDYRDSGYDVGCYNPALIVVKSAVVSDSAPGSASRFTKPNP